MQIEHRKRTAAEDKGKETTWTVEYIIKGKNNAGGNCSERHL